MYSVRGNSDRRAELRLASENVVITGRSANQMVRFLQWQTLFFVVAAAALYASSDHPPRQERTTFCVLLGSVSVVAFILVAALDAALLRRSAPEAPAVDLPRAGMRSLEAVIWIVVPPAMLWAWIFANVQLPPFAGSETQVVVFFVFLSSILGYRFAKYDTLKLSSWPLRAVAGLSILSALFAIWFVETACIFAAVTFSRQ
jgi:hypothetical protein